MLIKIKEEDIVAKKNVIAYSEELLDVRPMSPEEIVESFDQRIKELKRISKKLKKVRKKCKTAKREVEYAQDEDFKNKLPDSLPYNIRYSRFGKLLKEGLPNDYSTAIEYLQDACVALYELEKSSMEAMDLLFTFQRQTAFMMYQLSYACTNNLESMQALQKRIKRYIMNQKEKNKKLDEIAPILVELYARVNQEAVNLQNESSKNE